MAAAPVIKNFIAKQLFKQKGAIANNKSVEFSANALENRLKNLGIDPNAITSEKELNQILAYVKQAEDQAFQKGINEMLGGSKFDRKGEVFEIMSGKKLDSSQGIIGGTQINEQTLKEGLMKTDNPYSDLVNTPRPKTIKEREAEVLARMEKENKEAAQRIRDRKRLEDRALEDFVDDAGGVNPDDPRGIDDFIPDPEDMATGGRVGLMTGKFVKLAQLLKNEKKVNQAIDNIFPTGDVKYDATMAAESLVELNPKFFGNKLYDDLDSMTQLDIYDAVISPMMSAQAKALKMKKITKPEKTLQSMKEGKGINMSDPEIAKEFEQFMKQTDPEGSKKLEQTVELANFDPKGRKKNAQGGRAGFKGGSYDYNSFEHKINELKSAYKRYKKGSSTSGRGGIMTFEQFAPLFAKENFATGGRAGFKLGAGKKGIQALLDLFKPKPKPKFDVERFRKGPIDVKFLENIDKKDLTPFTRSRDTMGPGGYGMYDDFADMPAGLRAAELISRIKGPRNEINYKAAELFLGKKLKGNESVDELIQMLNRQEMRADGGRIGLKTGMTKRAFLKLMGGAGAGIAALKSGLLGFGKGKATKEVAKEVFQKSTTTPPPYFFELANKIKTLGKPDKVTYADRVEIHRYTGKNGDEFELIEDLNTGDMRIQKDKMGGANFGDESYEVIDDRTVLEYKKGDADIDVETGKGYRSADEYEEYKVEFDRDGTEAGVDEITANVQKEIIEEASGEAPSIKKASGGIARMLGE